MRLLQALLFGMLTAVFYAHSNIPDHVASDAKYWVFWIVGLVATLAWYVAGDRWPYTRT